MAKSKKRTCRAEIGSEAWEREVLEDDTGRFTEADKKRIKERRLDRKLDQVVEPEDVKSDPRL